LGPDREVILMRATRAEKLVVEPRAEAQQLCANALDDRAVARLVYLSSTEPPLQVQVGAYPLRDCIAATMARETLATAKSSLSSKHNPQAVGNGVRQLASAEELVNALPAGDRDKATLAAQLGDVRNLATRVAPRALDDLVAAAENQVNNDFQASVPAVATALRLADLVGDEGHAWARLYERVAIKAKEQGLDGHLALTRLLAADRRTSSCLQAGSTCPKGVTSDQARLVIGPTATAAAVQVERVTSDLERATTAITKRVDESSIQQVDAAVRKADTAQRLCAASDLLKPLDEKCAKLLAISHELTSRSEAAGQALVAIRAEVEARARKKRTGQIALTWRKHFSDCRRLMAADTQLAAMAFCDATCQQTVRRIDAERSRLDAFEPPEELEDPVLLSQLAKECDEASCRVCPHRRGRR
jgi:hypothetical protein